jgi:hypothetical protein
VEGDQQEAPQRGSGWDTNAQIRREYGFTDGRVIVCGKVAPRGQHKREYSLLFHAANLLLAVVEQKDNRLAVSARGVKNRPVTQPDVGRRPSVDIVKRPRISTWPKCERNLKRGERNGHRRNSARERHIL